MQDLKITYLQSNIYWGDPDRNRICFDEKIKRINDPVDLIVLPEMFTTAFPVDPHQFSEKIDGVTVQWMKEIASAHKTDICGSILLEENGNFYNALIWAKPDGRVFKYFKRHVFHLGAESEFISPGNEKTIIEIKGWKIAPMICYDLRFPVWIKNHFKDEAFAYDLLIFVANWPKLRSYAWQQLLVARAIENQSFVLGLNRVGNDNLGFEYSGDSRILGPDGKILQQAVASKEETCTFVFSKEKLLNFRQNFNVAYDWDSFEIQT
jgi:omega-amidase